jgi:D-alanyl-D-alanine carboxypeptidase
MKFILSSLLLAFTLAANAAPVQNNITAKSFLVVDDHGQELLAKNADHVQPIASITKLMTALVVLDSHQNLDEDLALNFKLAGRYHTKLPRNLKTLTRRELLELAIVKSDNFAAYTLCQHHWGGVDRCIADMNHMAVELRMTNTRFADPTGLDPANVSNARDLVKLVIAASEHREITEASGKPKVSIQVKRRWWQFGNTNPLVRRGDNIKVSKTGYIGASGGCIVMLLDTEVGERIVVLLNSKNTRTRIPEAAKIAVTVSHSDVSVD